MCKFVLSMLLAIAAAVPASACHVVAGFGGVGFASTIFLPAPVVQFAPVIQQYAPVSQLAPVQQFSAATSCQQQTLQAAPIQQFSGATSCQSVQQFSGVSSYQQQFFGGFGVHLGGVGLFRGGVIAPHVIRTRTITRIR
jgi:hypothetical protein